MVQRLGLRVKGLEVSVKDSGFRVQGLALRSTDGQHAYMPNDIGCIPILISFSSLFVPTFNLSPTFETERTETHPLNPRCQSIIPRES